MIKRQELIQKHNPVLSEIRFDTPLTVGNGEFAFTVDITGLQTLYEEHYENNVPLCTMSQWGWHTTYQRLLTQDNLGYTLDDLVMTEYENQGRIVKYAVEAKEGNEEVYHWLRENPHRANLARIGLLYKGESIGKDSLEEVRQELDLYSGVIYSQFLLDGHLVKVETVCHYELDMIGIKIQAESIEAGDLSVLISFPYGASNISASLWDKDELHKTLLVKDDKDKMVLYRKQDLDDYSVTISKDKISKISHNGHKVELYGVDQNLEFTCHFLKYECQVDAISYESVKESSKKSLYEFWEKGAILTIEHEEDDNNIGKAKELERRIILSMYLLRIQSTGSLPPQETGLTCNSWYGKFHLEMHPWHAMFLPLWNRASLLLKSIQWYKEHLNEAKINAQRNGYLGARWPKMVADTGIDSPSIIATLLVWQQPHLIYMLELCYQELIGKVVANKNDLFDKVYTSIEADLVDMRMDLAINNEYSNNEDSTNKDSENKKSINEGLSFIQEYYELVHETATFMCDFLVYNEQTKRYDLPSPLIPAQEEFDPNTTYNPTFELEYWHYTLKLAYEWSLRMGMEEEKWLHISNSMAELGVNDGKYLSFEGCEDTFTKYNKDHPSMVAALGLLPGNRVDKAIMENTMKEILRVWDFHSMWGWDFAMMAMTFSRLGKQEEALDMLLYDTAKNTYVASGNNYQKLRQDLPLYLPGNGSLLLSLPLIIVGANNEKNQSGKKQIGKWHVTYENMNGFPY